MLARARRWSSFALPAAMMLVPFEPRDPTLPLGPFHVTMLEGVALVAGGTLLLDASSRLRSWRPPLPLVLLAAFAAVELASAAASEDRGGSLKFALRMVFMAVFAAGVSLAEPGDRWRALLALAFGGAMAAGLAVAEGVGARGLDPALSAFREMPFNVAGVRRATAGSEYPNLGAACIAYGMLAATAAAAARGWRARTALVAVPFSLALLYTYSRGALVALAVGLLAAAATAGARRVRMAPLVSLGVLGLTAATFMSGREVFQLRLASEGLDAWYGARYEPVESALSLAPGAATMTAVKVTNTGRKAWTEEGQFHLSYHWYDVERHVVMDGGRTRLPRAMGPGDSAVLTAEVRAPGRPGSYLLLWDMVQEHTSWFSGQGVRPAAVRVRVGETSPAPTAVPAAPETSGLGWRPGRGELWSLAVRMWRAHPVLGVGPDRFRHLYGPWAGRAWWDDRVYANNLLLELAATVGTTGAALLAAALVAAALRAWRARRDAAAQPEAIAIVSLLAFVAAHGMVDYVLAFTGHYLVLAFALGAASGLGPRT